MMVTYIGTSIENKPAWMKQGEKLHKNLHSKLTGNYVPTIEETIIYLNCWLDFYNSKPCPNNRNMTIKECLNTVQKQDIDINKLDYLMMKSEVRTIIRSGITFLGLLYRNEMLMDYREKVFIRYSLFDLTKIFVVFPWVTAWRDYKSGKWLGWILQTGHPNSDLIFQSFYYAAEVYGLPEDVIIDNGKDYRSKDFAGGRKSVQVETNKPKTTSMLAELNVKVHFALPYNAQTKPIERDFLKIKELLSKHCQGYRGGNVVERPEKLAEEIKQNKLIPFDEFKTIFDDFIVNVLNKRPSTGKNLKG